MKVLFITDSLGLPRVFPEEEIVNLEETYAQLVKKEVNKESFHQISLAGDLSGKIIDQKDLKYCENSFLFDYCALEKN